MTTIVPSQQDLLISADRLISAGIPIVPVVPNAKMPSIAWSQLVEAPDLNVKRSLGAGMNLAAVLGGPRSPIVLDVDPRNGGDLWIVPEHMVTVYTPSGGIHCWFSRGPGYDPKAIQALKTKPGYDIKGISPGIVLVPPSVIDMSKYRWSRENIDFSSLPSHEELLKLPIFEQPSAGGDGPPGAHRRIPDSEMAEMLGGVRQGTRNSSAARIAGSLLRRGVDPSLVLELLHAWNSRNSPPLQTNELIKTFDSILGRFTRNRPDIVAKSMGADPTLSRLKVSWQTASELMRNQKTISWVWPGLLVEGGRAILSGIHGSGKSWHAIQMAMSLACQVPWLDWIPTRKYKTMLFQAEVGDSVMSDRFRICSNELCLSEEDLSGLLVANGTFHLSSRMAVDVVIRTLREQAIEALVIDPLQRFHALDENSSGAMNSILSELDRIRNEANLKALVIVHHQGKPSITGAPAGAFKFRGSSAIADWPNTRIMMTRFPNSPRAILEFVIRDAEPIEPKKIVFDKVWLSAELGLPEIPEDDSGGGNELD